MTPMAIAKRRGMMLTEEDVLGLIRDGQKDKTIRAYAEELGVSASYLADILYGRRGPGQSVLDFFGINKTIRTIVEYRRK
jgi:transcriptional regulator with XRE-family HTH domain